MTIVRTKEGPRAPLFYGALLLAAGGWSNAQTVDVSALEQCAALEAEADKLACFEAIVAETQDEPAATDAAETAPAEAPVEAAAVPAIDAPEPASEPADEAAPDAPLVDESVASAAAPAIAAESAATSSESAAVAPEVAAETATATSEILSQPEATDDEFGRDHLQRDSESDAPENVLRATVVEVTKGRHGVLKFHLDNGQIWQQLEPRYYPYPRNREFAAEISTGMMGEYSLQVDGKGRKVIVRRTK